MGRRCCIKGCNSRSIAPEHHGVTYHSFPHDTNIRSVWIQNTRLEPERNITKSVLVCSRHFRRADFQPMKSGKYLLKQRVFPTVFPWGKLEPGAVILEEVSATTTATVTPTTSATKTAAVGAAEQDVPADSATVEATIAQIMAETAELNAAAGIKPPVTDSPADADCVDNKVANEEQQHVSSPPGKRTHDADTAQEADDLDETADEATPMKQARTITNAITAVSPNAGARFEPVTSFTPGARLEAQDFDGVWHLARIIEVDNDDREVLIKFERIGKKSTAVTGTEEWIPMNSTRLRQKISTKPIPIFELEEKVMARWSGPRRFPATIKKILGKDKYEVLFDDGYVKNVRAIFMSKVQLSQEQQPQEQQSQLQPPQQKLEQLPSSTDPPTVASTPKSVSPAAATSTTKAKRVTGSARKDWPLLSMDKLDLASLNLPEIPKDGEWTCHWVNDQPIGREGFLYIGDHKKPTVVVDDWRLPAGWVKHMYQRSNVLGKWDVILVNPKGRRFRSRSDLKSYLDELGLVYNPDVHDFSIHRRRAKDINAYAFTDDYTPQHPVKSKPATNTSLLNDSGDVSLPLDLPLDASPAATAAAVLATELANSSGSKSQYIETPVAEAVPPMELMTPPAVPKKLPETLTAIASPTVAADALTNDGFAFIGGLKVQIVDNLFRCPQAGCAKNFRKENHLQIHIKHYHADLIKLLGACPKMQELAEKRTLGTPDLNEPQPKNQIPNQQFFAKLHQQDIEQSRAHRRSIGAATATAATAAAAVIVVAPVDTTATTVPAVVATVGQTPPELVLKTVEATAQPDTPTTADANNALNSTVNSAAITNTTLTDISTADSSMLELSMNSSNAGETETDLNASGSSITQAGAPLSKRARFSPSKRTAGSRKSNRQRTTRRYLTAAQATAGAPLTPVVTADSAATGFGDFEETRHAFNATPDVKQNAEDVAQSSGGNSSSTAAVAAVVSATTARKRKAPVAAAVANIATLSSLDSPITADSGSSSTCPPAAPTLPPSASAADEQLAVVAATPQYIKENGELIKIVRMRQEEIINCLCSYGEEDGLMIQCELCLCWQHGVCNGIDKESDVPDKYVCYICRHPQRGRESLRYKHDQDWLYEGKLPVASYHRANPVHAARFELLKRTHTLTGNLVELKRFMHSLRVKLNVANNKGHPKMYLWAKQWDDEEVQEEQKPETDDIKPLIKTEPVSTVDDAGMKTESAKLVAACGSPQAMQKVKSEPNTPSRAPPPPPPLMPNIPQPEAPIDPVECQQRLLQHVKYQQQRVMERLANIESEIDELEKQDTMPDLKNADLNTTKDVLSSFIKELDIMKQIAKINSVENQKTAVYNGIVIK